MKFGKLAAIALASTMVVGLAACNSGEPSTTGDVPSVIKIGIVNPTTGALAGQGEGCPWTEDTVVDYVNNELGGIYFEEYDATIPIEIVVYDSTSDTSTCSAMAQKLVEEDKVDLIIARHTPETVNPVCAIAERYGVPCVSIEAPVDAWLAEGAHEWSYHSFWTLDMMYEQYSALWAQAGYPAGSGATVGIIFANDADGTAWHDVFADRIAADGYNLIDPGQYPAGTTDFSDIINQFQTAGVQVLAGTNTNADFTTFWRQAQSLGFDPAVLTMGKAFLLQSDAEAVGASLMDGNMCEVWWSRYHPYTSALTGMTPEALAVKYNEETGKTITQPMGYKYASMELAVAALQNAKSASPEDILEAISQLNVETIVGPISYTNQELHYGTTPVVGGQWQLIDGKLDLVIINNELTPEVPTTGEYKPR